MRIGASLGLIGAASTLLIIVAPADARALIAPTQAASVRAINADVILIGKVVEIEKDTVEGPADPGAPKDQKATYKIAIVKIEDALIGAKGLTQVRVGFLADAPATGTPTVPGGGPVRVGRPARLGGGGAIALSAGMEGCFLLEPLPGADFYVAYGNGPPLLKKAENYEKELKAVQQIVKTFEDPVSALKAKDQDERFRAAYALLQRYQSVKGNPARVSRELIPIEESKLIVGVMAELPWIAKDAATPRPEGGAPTCRSALWYTINWAEHGFKQPNAAPGADYNKLMDEMSAAFLKNNADKIKLKRSVAK